MAKPTLTPLKSVVLIALALALSGFAGLSLWHGGRAALSDASSLSARWVVDEWRAGRGPAFTPELWLITRNSLQQALVTAPDNAQFYDDLGFLYASRAQALGAPAVGGPVFNYQQGLLDQAIINYRAATKLRPTFPYSWGYLALSKHLRQTLDDELWSAFDKALRYGRNEAGVQPPLAQVAFSHWPDLTDIRRNNIVQMVASAQPKARANLQNMAAQAGVTLPSH